MSSMYNRLIEASNGVDEAMTYLYRILEEDCPTKKEERAINSTLKLLEKAQEKIEGL